MSSLKLTERKIRYIVRAKKKGQSYKQISTDLKWSKPVMLILLLAL
ncbi:MAG: hypothetical protein ACP5NL_00415 [Thermoplasmata archaeon]